MVLINLQGNGTLQDVDKFFTFMNGIAFAGVLLQLYDEGLHMAAFDLGGQAFIDVGLLGAGLGRRTGDDFAVGFASDGV